MKFNLYPSVIGMIATLLCVVSAANEFFNHHDKVDTIILILCAILFSLPSTVEHEKKDA